MAQQQPNIPPAPPNPAAMSARDLGRVLTAAGTGGRITAAQIKADVKAGAPTNADGTLNLLHYAAWLAREDVARPEPDGG